METTSCPFAFLPRRTHGFTLVELAIVLVIIGLIVGGVLVGNDLIGAGRVRKTIGEKEQFDAAANTFKLKYGCIPGDCTNASSQGFGGSGGQVTFGTQGINGNGDGAACVEITGGSYDRTGCRNFWYYMYQAGMLKADNYPMPYDATVEDVNYPGYHTPVPPIARQNFTNPLYSVAYGANTGGWWLWDMDRMTSITAGTFPAPVPQWRAYWITPNQTGGSITAIVTNDDARALDEKMDDGKPLTGRMIVVRNWFYGAGSVTPSLNMPVASCVVSGLYVSSAVATTCVPVIRADF